jgi:hypothetical protein
MKILQKIFTPFGEEFMQIPKILPQSHHSAVLQLPISRNQTAFTSTWESIEIQFERLTISTHPPFFRDDPELFCKHFER